MTLNGVKEKMQHSETNPNSKQKIYDFSSHLAVEANAGSGKTTAIVNAFVNILWRNRSNKDFKLSEILVVTFTNNAAEELRQRVKDKINKVLGVLTTNNLQEYRIINEGLFTDTLKTEKTNDEELKEQVREFKRSLNINSGNLNNLQIFTIDAFNQRIFRDYSYKIELNNEFSILDKVLSDKVKNDLTLDSIARAYDSKNEVYITFFKDIFSLSSHNFFDIFSYLISVKLYNEDKEFKGFESVEEYKCNLYKLIAQNFRTFLKVLKDSQITDQKVGKDDSQRRFNNGRKLILDILNEYTNFNDEELLMRINETFKDDYKFNRTFPFKYCYNSLECKDISDKIKILNAGYENQLINRYFKYGKQFERIANELRAKYHEFKKDNALYDYDDIKNYVVDLLKIKEVRADIQSKYKYVVVDEFQDTNFDQLEIVNSICNLDLTNSHNSPLLMVVGDPKQSIYKFRGAEVAVFNKAIDLIRKKSGEVVKLDVTYRLTPLLCAAVNSLMANVMPDTEGSQNNKDIIKYLPLQSVEEKNNRKNDNSNDVIDLNSLDSKSRIELLIAKKDAENSDDQDESSETDDSDDNENGEKESKISISLLELSSKRIKQLINEGNENGSNYTLAFLTKSNASVKKITDYLSSKGISVVSYGGKGFFSGVVVESYIWYLEFILDNNYDYALIKTLQSPFFGLKHDEILNIFTNPITQNSAKDKISYFQRMEFYSNDYPDSIYANIYKQIKYVIEYSKVYDMPQLFTMMAKHSKWELNVAKQEQYRQSNENWNKLIDKVSEFSLRGFKTLPDLLEELQNLKKADSEGDAKIADTKNVVQVMTTHQAKGLQFDYVFITDFEFSDRNKNAIRYTKNFGIYKKYSIEKNEAFYKLLTTLDKEEDLEYQRNIYVAITRPKFGLFLCCEMVETSDKVKYNKIDKSLMESELITGALQQFEKDNFKNTNFEISTKLKFEGIEKDVKFKLAVISTIDDSELPKSDIRTEFVKRQFYTDTFLQGSIVDEEFSATRLKSIERNDGLDYFKKYVLAIPNLSNDYEHDSSDTKIVDSAFGAKYGTFLHGFLSSIGSWSNDIAEFNKSVLSYWNDYEKLNENEVATDIDKFQRRFFQEAINIYNSKFIQNRIWTDATIKTEVKYTMPLGVDLLDATIDVVFVNDGIAEIWDWKTVSNTEIEHVKSSYEIQMKFYCYFLSKLYPNQDNYSARLLLTSQLNSENDKGIIELIFTKSDFLSFEDELFFKIKEIKDKF